MPSASILMNPLSNILTVRTKVKTKERIRLKALAEGIILQAIEDLWRGDQRDECIKFFGGEGFHHCANIAGMGLEDQIKLLKIVNQAIQDSKEES